MMAAPLVLAVAGCAAPSTRIASALTRYGIDPARAECVGQSLSGSLSLAQLQQLGRAAAAYRQKEASPARLTSADLAQAAGQIRDPAILLAVGRAGLACNVAPVAR